VCKKSGLQLPVKSIDGPKIAAVIVGRSRWLCCRQLQKPPEVFRVAMQMSCQIVECLSLPDRFQALIENVLRDVWVAHFAPRLSAVCIAVSVILCNACHGIRFAFRIDVEGNSPSLIMA